MSDAISSAAGRWARLKQILPTNWRSIVAWAITLLFVFIGNCIRQRNGDEPQPLPIPPTPIFPEEPFGWRPPSEEERKQTLDSLATPRWADTEAAEANNGPDDDAPVWRFYAKVNHGAFPRPRPGTDRRLRRIRHGGGM